MEEKIERQAKELKTLVYYSYQYAGVAQLAEQYFRKVEVASSTLASGSNGINICSLIYREGWLALVMNF